MARIIFLILFGSLGKAKTSLTGERDSRDLVRQNIQNLAVEVKKEFSTENFVNIRAGEYRRTSIQRHYKSQKLFLRSSQHMQSISMISFLGHPRFTRLSIQACLGPFYYWQKIMLAKKTLYVVKTETQPSLVLPTTKLPKTLLN